MPQPPDPRWPSVSDAELELLKLLWRDGAATVRELHQRLSDRDWAYTTVQKMLSRLEEKGYVDVDRSGFAHVFAAAVNRDSLLGQRLAELTDKLCDGAAATVLRHLVENQRFSVEEIRRFRQLLDDAERREKP